MKWAKRVRLAAGFFDAVIKVRLPEGKGLIAWPAGQEWAGDLKSFEVKAADASKPSSGLNSWLPDETMAGQWRAFMRGEFAGTGGK